MIMPDAVDLVGDTDLDLVELIEHVEFRERDLRQRVDAGGMAHHHGIEPAGATATARVGPVLVSDIDEVVADLVEQLGRERTGTDSRDVRLRNADDAFDVARADTGAGARAAGHRVGRGDERVRAVVEIEEGRLRPFEEDVLAGLECVVHDRNGVADVRDDPRRARLEVLGGDLVGIDRLLVEDLGEHLVGVTEDNIELGPENLGIGEILDPQADTHRLVGVRRADAPLGRAELGVAEVAFV